MGNGRGRVAVGIELEALEVLNCFNNVIGLSLPDDLGELANLTEVNMAANKLAMLKDPVFKNWSKVEVLNLNRFTANPAHQRADGADPSKQAEINQQQEASGQRSKDEKARLIARAKKFGFDRVVFRVVSLRVLVMKL